MTPHRPDLLSLVSGLLFTGLAVGLPLLTGALPGGAEALAVLGAGLAIVGLLGVTRWGPGRG